MVVGVSLSSKDVCLAGGVSLTLPVWPVTCPPPRPILGSATCVPGTSPRLSARTQGLQGEQVIAWGVIFGGQNSVGRIGVLAVIWGSLERAFGLFMVKS